MDNQISKAGGSNLKSLYRISGAAALIAAILLRRNLGVEIALFSAQKQPAAVADWFALLQSHRLLGLAYLNVFDLANYALVGLMFLALYFALRPVNPGRAAIAAALGFLGVAVALASNTALSLAALSDQYTAAATEAEKALLLSAGQALLALNRFSLSGAAPGSGGYLSLLFVAAAGLLFSLAMLRSRVFGRAAAIVGILANALDLAYCLAYPFVPAAVGELLAVLFIPAAGLFFLAWHLLTGWRLLRLGGREAAHFEGKALPRPS